jgi:hypothetical protein
MCWTLGRLPDVTSDVVTSVHVILGMSDEERRSIEVQALSEVAAEHLALVVRRMKALDGPDWAGGADLEVFQMADGPDQGRLVFRVGERQFRVDGDELTEMTIVQGQPVRRRVIDHEGVVVDDKLIDPDAN